MNHPAFFSRVRRAALLACAGLLVVSVNGAFARGGGDSGHGGQGKTATTSNSSGTSPHIVNTIHPIIASNGRHHHDRNGRDDGRHHHKRHHRGDDRGTKPITSAPVSPGGKPVTTPISPPAQPPTTPSSGGSPTPGGGQGPRPPFKVE